MDASLFKQPVPVNWAIIWVGDLIAYSGRVRAFGEKADQQQAGAGIVKSVDINWVYLKNGIAVDLHHVNSVSREESPGLYLPVWVRQ